MDASYYDRNAQTFVDGTLDADVKALYEPFLSRLPAQARILDAGCGSGRDMLAFLKLGYFVEAFDASEKMAELASKVTGRAVAVARFQDVDYKSEFDGIWACASLLHVPASEIDDVVLRLANALKPDGILYASFKLGYGERLKDGRLFVDYNHETFSSLINRTKVFSLEQMSVSADVRPERAEEKWLNCICKKSH
jgi:SAM-dependent methyltransferase